ncbi:OmpA family protein [Flaviramulus basaltis]|uniref:OmpA family protein n=1 Tax=Flaviramulus basaltis TaxID=369401 RepID=A0A1K2IMD7_9FLAO|nr:OmpA family protein [Flaviramulus basaltis]SFZ93418.1 OmpA family protein [Flaviramulus basaltis]
MKLKYIMCLITFLIFGLHLKAQNSQTESSEESSTNQSEVKVWSKYNFVPGDEIIFQDDLLVEENGEFPSRWDLLKGNAENAVFENENAINFENRSIVTPLIDKQNYLPEIFTIEFDAYFNDVYYSWQSYNIRFWKGTKEYIKLNSENDDIFKTLKIHNNGAYAETRIEKFTKKFEGYDDNIKGQLPGWKHIAISFNKRTLKVFVDQYRALNIPNLKIKPEIVSIESYTNNKDGLIMAIKNVRIAEGGKKLYDRVMSDGKFVTTGILFDVNKATLKPESMGIINEVAKMMQEHPDLNFSIEGHTDSDGADDYNQQLSEQRANTVKGTLIELGIDETRLQTKGLGESVLLNDNNTAENKANNRRVEFIKI